jgi:hypothetical protein
MKIFSFLPIFIVLIVTSFFAFAQNDARKASRPEPTATPDRAKLKHFDLDFPGGTPAELVAAISQAMGKHLNVMIPPEHAKVRIMPVKVQGVTVPELFDAIGKCSVHETAEGKVVGFCLLPSSSVTDETIWSFRLNAP